MGGNSSSAYGAKPMSGKPAMPTMNRQGSSTNTQASFSNSSSADEMAMKRKIAMLEAENKTLKEEASKPVESTFARSGGQP